MDTDGARVVGTSSRVVDAPGLVIDELVGNVASQDDRISIAQVLTKAGTSEPWLTLHYDEWICVTEGEIRIEQEGKNDFSILGGQSAMIPKGTRFKPTFVKDSKYVPVCLPAFRPDRCIREDVDDEGHKISKNLKSLHSKAKKQKLMTTETKPEILYHMTTKAQWEDAKKMGTAYYPTTFEQDGHYTHATGVPARLITTANHFYQDVEGEWVCLEFTRTNLKNCGIFVKDEEAMPVGDQAVSDEWQGWICPHVIGGIPIGVVDKEHPMVREGKCFKSI